jgi:hypothetical protein
VVSTDRIDYPLESDKEPISTESIIKPVKAPAPFKAESKSRSGKWIKYEWAEERPLNEEPSTVKVSYLFSSNQAVNLSLPSNFPVDSTLSSYFSVNTSLTIDSPLPL